MDILERRAAITGIGQSVVGRRLGRTGIDLTVEAILAALDDAGLDRKNIDGVASWPGYRAVPPGSSTVHIYDIRDALDLRLNWYSGGAEGPSQLTSVLNACMAVASGQARHVICFRTVTEATASAVTGKAASAIGDADSNRVEGGPFQWQLPFNVFSAANFTAMYAQRYMHEHGLRREQLAQIALNARRNAALNPKAIYRTPLTLDDYMSSRMISTPLCLYDCDVPVDGSTVLIVSHVDAARDLRCPAVKVEAICGTLQSPTGWEQFSDLTLAATADAARRLWSRTDLKPKDVDVAELYDGFSYLTLQWIEALGFCGRGEAGDFIEGGKRIALDGDLPINTHGGQLSGGRLHGLGLMHEAVVQLRGQGGERQVKGNPKVAVVTNGGGPLAGCALLRKD